MSSVDLVNFDQLLLPFHFSLILFLLKLSCIHSLLHEIFFDSSLYSLETATFERVKEFVLAGLIGTSCLVYLDDIVPFSRMFEEHLAQLREVLCRLKDAGLKVKPSKCFLFREEIAYLGHVVSTQGISTDPRKTEAIHNYPVPQNVQEVWRFVGFASYYRCFIPNFAELAAPLHQLTQKSTKFLWTQECQNAFQELKEKFTEAHILGFPHFDAPFILYTDASDYGIGSVLSQKIDGTERVIAYTSCQLSKWDQQHQVDWDGTRVLDRAARPVQLKVKEALHIKRTPANNRLNPDGGYELPGCGSRL